MRLFLTVILFAATAALSSCRKCEGDAPKFTAEELQWLPEQAPTQKVLFRSSSGDTLFYRQQRTIDYPETYVGKGGSKTCPEDGTTLGLLEFSRKNLPNNGSKVTFLADLKKRRNAYEQLFTLDVPEGYSYRFIRFTEHLPEVTLGQTKYLDVEQFDATRYNDSVGYQSARRLHQLYFKKGVGVLGYSFIYQSDTASWYLVP